MDVTRLTTRAIYSPETRSRHMAHAMGLGLPYLKVKPEKKGRVALIGGGPSINTQVEAIKALDAKVWCVNGALGWCLDHGIKPHVWLAIDPMAYVASLLDRAPKHVRYYVASRCHPAVFEALKGRKVWLWHSGEWDALPPKGHIVVPGGPTVLCRAPYVAHMQGYREIHIFGADGSFAPYFMHGYGDRQHPPDSFQVRVGEQVFLTQAMYMHAAAYMCKLKESFPGELVFHGDGLCQALIKSEVRQDISMPEGDYLIGASA